GLRLRLPVARTNDATRSARVFPLAAVIPLGRWSLAIVPSLRRVAASGGPVFRLLPSPKPGPFCAATSLVAHAPVPHTPLAFAEHTSGRASVPDRRCGPACGPRP